MSLSPISGNGDVAVQISLANFSVCGRISDTPFWLTSSRWCWGVILRCCVIATVCDLNELRYLYVHANIQQALVLTSVAFWIYRIGQGIFDRVVYQLLFVSSRWRRMLYGCNLLDFLSHVARFAFIHDWFEFALMLLTCWRDAARSSVQLLRIVVWYGKLYRALDLSQWFVDFPHKLTNSLFCCLATALFRFRIRVLIISSRKNFWMAD